MVFASLAILSISVFSFVKLYVYVGFHALPNIIFFGLKSKILFPTSRLSVHPFVPSCVCVSKDQLQFLQADHKMSLIKIVPYVLGMAPGVPCAPEPRMYPRSRYFLVIDNLINHFSSLSLKFRGFHFFHKNHNLFCTLIFFPKSFFEIHS